MADVFEGWPTDDESLHVALKVPLSDLPEPVKELFLREAAAARRVASEHVVRVLDYGDNPSFIALEFIDGPTLDEVLHTWDREHRERADTELVPLYSQLARAMRV